MKNLEAFSTFYNYIYCIFAGSVLLEKPVIAAAYFLMVEALYMLLRFAKSKQQPFVSLSGKLVFYFATGLCFLSAFGLVAVYPFFLKNENIWLLFALVILTFIKKFLSLRVDKIRVSKALSDVQFKFRLFYSYVILNALVLLILYVFKGGNSALYLWLGYLATSILGLLRPISRRNYFVQKQVDFSALKNINAYKTYKTLAILCVTAQQLTLYLIFAFFPLANISAILAALFIIFAAIKLADIFCKRSSDFTNTIIAGLVLWLLGFVAYIHNMTMQNINLGYLSLSLSAIAASISLNSLEKINEKMRDVIDFASSKPENKSAGDIIANFAMMLGKMVSLIYLSMIVFFGKDFSRVPSPLQVNPNYILPALLLVLFAVIASLRFPLNILHFKKLHRFLLLKENGETNAALQKQLENAVINVQKRHYGLRILMFFGRLFLRSKVKGKENIPKNRDGDIIYLCNHGEIYGPIVGGIYTPMPIRPWVISEMCSPALVRQYIYEGTFEKMTFLPLFMRKALAGIVSPIIIWGMNSLDPVPVYRNQSSELIKTFRASLQAMQSGDNLLIFPENPFHENLNTGQYLRSGVGEFFEGFCAIAPSYYNKTGRKCLFIPVYASKQSKTIHYCPPIEFDPDNHFIDEAKRICRLARASMLQAAESEEQTGAQ